MPAEGPRLTEERLRYHLDSNQVMRERLCLALMPLIGPYTRERPRRPKGGPDGGRDIEAIHEGSTVAWGAVGFRNGGGNDEQARREASTKCESDLSRSLQENSTLQAFVFFREPGTQHFVGGDVSKNHWSSRVWQARGCNSTNRPSTIVDWNGAKTAGAQGGRGGKAVFSSNRVALWRIGVRTG